MTDATASCQLIDILDVETKGDPKPKLLVKSAPINVMRLVMPAGKAIPEHRSAKEITVQCVSGEVDFTVMGITHRMTRGKLLFLPPGELHSLTAITDSIMLVTKVN